MDRAHFIKTVADTLSSDKHFDSRKVLDIDDELSILTFEERSQIESFNRFPQWFVDAVVPDASKDVTYSQNYASKVVIPASSREFLAPKVIQANWVPQGMWHCDKQVPEVKVTEGKDLTFHCPNFQKSAVLPDGYIQEMTDKNGIWASKMVRGQEPTHLKGRTLICVKEGSSMPSHWLMDTLPKLKIAEMAGHPLESFDNILFAVTSRRFQKETLEFLGVDKKAKILSREELGSYFKMDEFVSVSRLRPQNISASFAYDFLREKFCPRDENFVSGLLGTRKKPTDRIYVSRAKASTRRIVNEAELVPILERHGFKILYLEDLGILGGAKAFSGASTVVAPHGAGLVNLAFAPEGCHVLEIYGAHLNNEYWHTANIRNMPYWCLQGTDSDRNPITEQMRAGMSLRVANQFDLWVDPVVFEKALETVVK